MTPTEIESSRHINGPQAGYFLANTELSIASVDSPQRLELGRLAAVCATAVANHKILPTTVRHWLEIAQFELKRTHLNHTVTINNPRYDEQFPNVCISAEMARDISRFNLAASATSQDKNPYYASAKSSLSDAHSFAPDSPSGLLAQIEMDWLAIRQNTSRSPNTADIYYYFLNSSHVDYHRRLDVISRAYAVGHVHHDETTIDLINLYASQILTYDTAIKSVLKYRAEIARSLVLPYLFLLTHTPTVSPIENPINK